MALNRPAQKDRGWIVPGHPAVFALRFTGSPPVEPVLIIEGGDPLAEHSFPAVMTGNDAQWALTVEQVDALLEGQVGVEALPFHIDEATPPPGVPLVAGTIRIVSEWYGSDAVPFNRLTPVISGPMGPPGASDPEAIAEAVADWMADNPQTFVHDQLAPVSTWVIPHPLERRPGVTVFLATGEEVEADVTASSTVVSITFPAPMVGQAILT